MQIIRNNYEILDFYSANKINKFSLKRKYWFELPKEDWTFEKLTNIAREVFWDEYKIKFIMDDLNDSERIVWQNSILLLTAPKEVILTAINYLMDEENVLANCKNNGTIFMAFLGSAVDFENYQLANKIFDVYMKVRSDLTPLDCVVMQKQLHLLIEKSLSIAEHLLEELGKLTYDLSNPERFIEDVESINPELNKLLTNLSGLDGILNREIS